MTLSSGIPVVRGKISMTQQQPAGMVAWATAPQLIDRQTAAYLCGVDVETIQQIIDANGVELVDAENGDCLIDRASLREFWEICTELPSYTN
jgi:hypothetical protein